MVLSVFRLVMNGALKTAFEGHLHLHPISQTHQFRPTLTYMDVFHRKNRRRANGDDDSDSDSDFDDVRTILVEPSMMKDSS